MRAHGFRHRALVSRLFADSSTNISLYPPDYPCLMPGDDVRQDKSVSRCRRRRRHRPPDRDRKHLRDGGAAPKVINPLISLHFEHHASVQLATDAAWAINQRSESYGMRCIAVQLLRVSEKAQQPQARLPTPALVLALAKTRHDTTWHNQDTTKTCRRAFKLPPVGSAFSFTQARCSANAISRRDAGGKRIGDLLSWPNPFPLDSFMWLRVTKRARAQSKRYSPWLQSAYLWSPSVIRRTKCSGQEKTGGQWRSAGHVSY